MDAQTAAPVTLLPPATGRGMGTTFEASKPVLATYSSPVIPVLTTEAALDDAGALAGWARSVYADPAATVEHCGSRRRGRRGRRRGRRGRRDRGRGQSRQRAHAVGVLSSRVGALLLLVVVTVFFF